MEAKPSDSFEFREEDENEVENVNRRFKSSRVTSVSDEEKYLAIKKKLGFQWWSLKRLESEVILLLDGKEFDNFVADLPTARLGRIKKAEAFDYKLIEFTGDTDMKTTLGVWDFQRCASDFAKNFRADTSAHVFCKNFMHMLQNEESDEEILTETDQHINQDDSEKEEEQSIAVVENIDQTQNNTILQKCHAKKLGQMTMSIDNLKFADAKYSVRNIDSGHMAQLLKQVEANFLNKKFVAFPPAVGLTDVPLDQVTTVQIIDGNHSLGVLKQLHEKYPEEDCFKYREVIVYRGLTQAEAITLGLLHNECNLSKETSANEKMKIMRRELLENFDGKFCSNFHERIYCIFNAVCKDDKSLEEKKRKKLQHLIRVSSMEEQCCPGFLTKILDKYPNTSVFHFAKLSNISKASGLDILSRILEGTKASHIGKMLPEYPIAKDGEQLVLQRIREKKTKSTKTKKQTDKTKEMQNKNANDQNDQVNLITDDQTDTDLKILQAEVKRLKENESANRKIIEDIMEEKRELKETNSELIQRNDKLIKEINTLQREKKNLEEALRKKTAQEDVYTEDEAPTCIGSTNSAKRAKRKDYAEMLKVDVKGNDGRDKTSTLQEKQQREKTTKKRKNEEETNCESDENISLPFSTGEVKKRIVEEVYDVGELVECYYDETKTWYRAKILDQRPQGYFIQYTSDKIKEFRHKQFVRPLSQT